MQESRQTSSFFLSLGMHVMLIALAVIGVGDGLKVDMDKPMYTVDLVSLNPSEDPAAGETGEAAGGPPPQAEQDAASEQSAAASKPAEPIKAEKAKPEPVRDDAKAISEKKVEDKKKPDVKEDKKPPEKKPEEKKAEEKKPSKEDLLKEALQDVKKDVSSKDKAKPEAPKGRDAIASELAELRKGTGGNIYTTGGTGPGGAGGGKGTGAGGTGSGLMSVYGAIVEQAIKKNWRYPVFGSNQAVAVVIEIKIDPRGKISSSRVLTPSGKPDFDDSAMRAVSETQSLPVPPSKSVDTLRITFNLQDLRK